MAFASLIIALGALLLSAVSLLVSMNNRKEASHVQIEQKKQEALGVLLQSQLANSHQLSSLQLTRQLAARTSALSLDLEKQIEQTIASCEQADVGVAEIIEALEGIDAKRRSSRDLVQMETILGQSRISRLRIEDAATTAEQVNSMLLEYLGEPTV